MRVTAFLLRIKGKPNEYPKSQIEFSNRLSQLRRAGEVVRPIVKVDSKWMKYTDYKKLKKEEGNYDKENN